MYRFILILLLIFVGTACSNQEVRRPIQQVSHQGIEASVNLNQKIFEEELSMIKTQIQSDSVNSYLWDKRGFYKTKLKAGSDTLLPTRGQSLVYKASYADLEHKIIYRDSVYTLRYLGQDAPIGLIEALGSMSEQESAQFYFPSMKMFGILGDGNQIKGYQPLFMKIELLEIE